MKAGVFSGSGAMLILTSYKTLTNPGFVDKLSAKGINILLLIFR